MMLFLPNRLLYAVITPDDHGLDLWTFQISGGSLDDYTGQAEIRGDGVDLPIIEIVRSLPNRHQVMNVEFSEAPFIRGPVPHVGEEKLVIRRRMVFTRVSLAMGRLLYQDTTHLPVWMSQEEKRRRCPPTQTYNFTLSGTCLQPDRGYGDAMSPFS